MAEFENELYQVAVVDVQDLNHRREIQEALLNGGYIVADDNNSNDIHVLVYKEDK